MSSKLPLLKMFFKISLKGSLIGYPCSGGQDLDPCPATDGQGWLGLVPPGRGTANLAYPMSALVATLKIFFELRVILVF